MKYKILFWLVILVKKINWISRFLYSNLHCSNTNIRLEQNIDYFIKREYLIAMLGVKI